MDKTIMLDRIKEFYGFQTDVDFARYLGITPQVLSNWKSRNSFDAELLYGKCPELNPSWLLRGDGPMTNQTEVGRKHVNEDKSPYTLRKRLNYLEKEIKALTEADKIMTNSGNEIKKAIKLLENQLKETREQLEGLLNKKP